MASDRHKIKMALRDLARNNDELDIKDSVIKLIARDIEKVMDSTNTDRQRHGLQEPLSADQVAQAIETSEKRSRLVRDYGINIDRYVKELE
ncbi:MAG: hypothetical protein GF332_01020 [Candidatus Moranbacteria bacterium]|nr:hypothetical protein [Candidatus Moranbacteria bacterium]